MKCATGVSGGDSSRKTFASELVVHQLTGCSEADADGRSCIPRFTDMLVADERIRERWHAVYHHKFTDENLHGVCLAMT